MGIKCCKYCDISVKNSLSDIIDNDNGNYKIARKYILLAIIACRMHMNRTIDGLNKLIIYDNISSFKILKSRKTQ